MSFLFAALCCVESQALSRGVLCMDYSVRVRWLPQHLTVNVRRRNSQEKNLLR